MKELKIHQQSPKPDRRKQKLTHADPLKLAFQQQLLGFFSMPDTVLGIRDRQ